MKKAEVEIGGKYHARVSGKLTVVQINCVGYPKGWNATNVKTGREVHIKSAQRLRSPAGGKYVVTCDDRFLATEPHLKRWVEDQAKAHRFPSVENASAYFSRMSGHSVAMATARIIEVAK
jgi:hypothetical protein